MVNQTAYQFIEGASYKLPNDIEVITMRVSETIPAGTLVKIIIALSDETLEVKTKDYGRFQIHVDDLVDYGYPSDDASPEQPNADYWSEG